MALRVHYNLDGSDAVINIMADRDMKLVDVLQRIAKKRHQVLPLEKYQFKTFEEEKRMKGVRNEYYSE